jgi:serine protease Do
MKIAERTGLLVWLLVALGVAVPVKSAVSPGLPRERTKSGTATLAAFAPVITSASPSIIEFEIDGKAVALGAILDPAGLSVTKASEVSKGDLHCRLSDGRQVSAKVLETDEENDLALVRVDARGLKPISWAQQDAVVGQWAVTPGTGPVPEAVGIISVPPRKIPPKQALIGVQLDFEAAEARIARIIAGLGAEQAGLKAGDTVLAVNSLPVKGAQELIQVLRKFREGQTVKLRLRRDSEEIEADVLMKVPPPDRPPRGSRGRNRQEWMNRVGGEVSRRAEGFQMAIQHDTVLQPWQCGGPLLNLDGEALGLNIARAGRIASYALPASLVLQLVQELQQRENVPVKEDAPTRQ